MNKQTILSLINHFEPSKIYFHLRQHVGVFTVFTVTTIVLKSMKKKSDVLSEDIYCIFFAKKVSIYHELAERIAYLL